MRIIIILILIFLFFRMLFRFFIPWLLYRKVKQMQDKQNNAYSNREKRNKSEGDITIENIPEDRKSGKKRRKKFKDNAEYADYEEVNDED
ncbi:MAG: DUF4834 family protein [Bacteroidales bacterium]